MVNGYFNKINEALNQVDKDSIQNVANLISGCKGQIFVFGNGGSASTASHFAQDMNKNLDYKFICLNDNIPSILAYANDINFGCIFKMQLSKLINSGDMVIGFSCSGNSQNIIDAIVYAKHYGYMTVGFTGITGGSLKDLVEHNIHVPSNDMQVCEDIHLIITHTIMKLLS
jgi:D-sedoheptulose 7-phosphate isomerase